ncbi:Paired amphipathic helix (PAH2) superfamily protein [Raphanus sativus]|uniref:Uncharacterized protein LOC108807740 n=1 Tax=Raphanus sativus TaxID=3726 RepID=A0A6J0JKH1_RAPSA|nr:uncharacterized protein LOC108807740 [Raphanus sativus]XP_018435491.1 uncharacterized protein LOC108807742 [Raphanus sativus]KAJ4869581.1 Paired amphipathic helix (PAH2) superfamily protein [Raphanus sativus]KAJ4887161.1 Paired amphipathic helix (PAH2) superfamily protein [Raphanus sativus]
MRGFNRPRKSQGRDLFYQTPSPTNFSEEEIQRNIEFLKKLQEADDKTLYPGYERMMQRYLSGSITYVQLRRGLFVLLCRDRGLAKELRQLLSYFASPVRNHYKKEDPKYELERSVAFLRKVEALGESVYKAFMDALGFSGDKEVMIEQLREILRGHESLKEELETFLIDNRLLNRKRDCVNDRPSYWFRPEVEKGSSSGPVLKWKYNSGGSYRPEDSMEKRSEACRDEKMNRFEDMLLHDLDSFIEFGKVSKDDLRNKRHREMPRVGLSGLLEWLCNGKKVPPGF